MGGNGGTWVILNPSAGRGRAERTWPALAERLRDAIGPFTQAVTCGPGDAIGLARQAVEAGARRIVVAGGDGTLNEVVNGCLLVAEADRPLPTLALLPVGTGADFARGLGIGTIEDAVAALHHDTPRPIDVARAAFRDESGEEQARTFINVADFGLGPAASRHLAQADPRLGRAAYLASALRAIPAYQPVGVRVRADDRLAYAGPSGLLAIGNGRFFGGGMAIAPKARPDDGLLDAVILGDTDRRQLVADLLPRVYRGTHLRHPAVHLARGATIAVEADEPLPLELDGEIVGTTPARFTVLPGRIAMLTLSKTE